MRFITIIVCAVVGVGCVASLGYRKGYIEGRHDGWWARDLGSSMYGPIMYCDNHGLCIKP